MNPNARFVETVMENNDIALKLKEIGDAYDRVGEKWRALAFQKASNAIANYPEPLAELGEFPKIEGIGKAIKGVIGDILSNNGNYNIEKKLRRKLPPATIDEFQKIPRVGPKLALKIWETLGVVNLAQLEEKVQKGSLSGLAESQQEIIVNGLVFIKRQKVRLPLASAIGPVMELKAQLENLKTVNQISLAGSMRRYKSSIRDVDFVVQVSDRRKFRRQLERLFEVERGGDNKITLHVEIEGEPRQVDIVMADRKSIGNHINYLTGSRDFNIAVRKRALQMGYTVNEHRTERISDGRRMPSAKEADLFRILETPWVPPECRIDGTEIGLDLSDLVEREDVKGDLHLHTVYSDGIYEVKELVALARKAGLEYLGIADHSPNLGITHGLSAEELLKFKRRMRRLSKRLDFPVHVGTELDINLDGSPGYPLDVVHELDYVILATHISPTKDIERRLVGAMRRIKIPKIIAHITGRVVGQRDAATANWRRIFKVCRETDTAIEINALRLDPPASLIRMAHNYDLKYAIHSDLHDGDFGLLDIAVIQARKGLVRKSQLFRL